MTELPHDADGLCAECGEPGELREELCTACRCRGCGEPMALIEWREARWCAECASESGYVRPVYAVAAE